MSPSPNEIYCTVQLPAIYLKPIYDNRPPEYFLTPRYKRHAAKRAASRKRRTTFKQRMRNCWHEKKVFENVATALRRMRRTK